MAKTTPLRVDDALYASAKVVGPVMSRSAAQQIEHWARIGREVEAAASTSHQAVAEVLAGSRNYDALTAREQALVRAEWAARLTATREGLDLAARFAAQGRTYVEADDEGRVVERSADTA